MEAAPARVLAPPGRVLDRSSRIFELAGGHPALDLVNTLDWRFRDSGTDELLSSYADLLAFTEQCGLLTARQARRLRNETAPAAANRVLRETRDLREALAETLYARIEARRPAATALTALERHLKAARHRETLASSGPRFAWELAGGDDTPDCPLLLLARAAGDLLVSPTLDKLRDCGDPQCRWLFLDTSKNHTRRWCKMAVCGNRMKARRFRERR